MNMKKIWGMLLAIVPLMANAQVDEFEEAYRAFRQQAVKKYGDFRRQCNEEYAEFTENAWRRFNGYPPKLPPIKDKPIPPMPYDGGKDGIKDKQLPYLDIVPITPPVPQPKPIEPIKEQPQPVDERFTFHFYGTEGRVRLSDEHRFTLNASAESEVANAWRLLSGGEYDNVIRDCLELRIRHGLCDWGYLQMLQELGYQFFGTNTNEATLLTAYLYCQSGYKMRIGRGTGGRIYLMVATRHSIYDRSYFRIDSEDYYPLDCQEGNLYICQASFPQEQPLSLWITQETNLAENRTEARALMSELYPQVTDHVTSDYILLNNQRFTVCDPTYIGAPIGATMPDMDNAGAKVILLE